MVRTKFPNVKPERTRVKFISDVVENPLIPEELKNIDNPDFIEKFMGTSYFDEDDNLVENNKIKWKDNFMRHVYYLAKNGWTNPMLADFFGVDESTIRGWQMRHPEFTTALLQGRDIHNLQVIAGTHKSATGFFYDETEKIITYKNGEEEISTRTTRKYVPGNPVAQKYWLNNRMPEQWSDTKHTEIKTNVNVEHKLDLSMLNEEEQRLIKSIGMKKLSQSHGISTK
jgi:hypothetical protein